MPETEKKSAPAGAVLRAYWRHTARYPYLFAIAMGGLILVQVGRVILPLYLRDFINLLAALPREPESIALIFVPLAFYAFWTLMEWFGYRVEMWAGLRIGVRVAASLTEEAFSYLIKHSYRFFSSSFSGALTRKVSRYSAAYERLYDSVMLSIVPTILYVSGMVVVLAYLHPVMGAALALWTVFFVYVQWLMIRWQQPLRRKRAEEDSNVTAAVADAISNQSTIALFSGNRHEERRLGKVNAAFREALFRTWNADMWIFSVQGLLAIGINVGILALAVFYWQRGLFQVGDFILVQSYVFGLFERTWDLGRQFRNIYSSVADAGEMVAILETPHEVRDRPNAEVLSTPRGTITFRDVEFRFHDGRPVLEDFNLTIRSHEKVALVGPSGAGKTTITKLLLRLYDVEKGVIEIDGQNIFEVAQDSLREAIAFVPQEPILFHRTLMENIRYGRRDATDAEVFDAARKAHCHEFIAAPPAGYATYAGERGVMLSGGDRQRVGIACTILKNAPILVLDEATSSLDSESEALIQDALATLMEGKTVVVIAHRLSTIQKADRIVVMEGGQVAAQGTHQELLAQDGLYRKLWSIQAGGFIGGSKEESETETANYEEDREEGEASRATPPTLKEKG